MKQEIIRIAHHLHNKNMLAADDGSISYRYNNTEILITPPSKSKSQITPDDVAIITIDGQIKKGKPSPESFMHLAIYQLCPKAKCVIHTHPPKATAWTVARPDLKELPVEILHQFISRVPIVPYQSDSKNFNDALKPYLPEYRMMLLARYGAITWGDDLEEALNRIERLEHAADILIYANMISGIGNSLTHHAA